MTEQPVKTPDNMAPDYFLQALVKLVETHHIETVITVTVGGAFISGKIISRAAYFDNFANQFHQFLSQHWPQEDAENMRKYLVALGEAEENMPGDTPGETYLHMSNISFILGSSMASSNNAVWRARLSSIEGFFLGSMNPQQN